jgi:hypothetical protein
VLAVGERGARHGKHDEQCSDPEPAVRHDF